MKSRRCSFNPKFVTRAAGVLAVGLAALLGGGCQTHMDRFAQGLTKTEVSTIRLSMETSRTAGSSTSGAVYVTRQRFPYNIEREPFLTEADLAKATVVESPEGGYAIQLLFNDHGSLILEMNTSGHGGRHVIVYSQFPKPGAKAKKEREKKNGDDDTVAPAGDAPAEAEGERQSAWLAAVLLRGRISNGVFTFTPDASREETDRIVRGLQNVIKATKRSGKGGL